MAGERSVHGCPFVQVQKLRNSSDSVDKGRSGRGLTGWRVGLEPRCTAMSGVKYALFEPSTAHMYDSRRLAIREITATPPPRPNPGAQTRRRPLTSRTHSGGVMGWLISEQRYGQQLKV